MLDAEEKAGSGLMVQSNDTNTVETETGDEVITVTASSDQAASFDLEEGQLTHHLTHLEQTIMSIRSNPQFQQASHLPVLSRGRRDHVKNGSSHQLISKATSERCLPPTKTTSVLNVHVADLEHEYRLLKKSSSAGFCIDIGAPRSVINRKEMNSIFINLGWGAKIGFSSNNRFRFPDSMHKSLGKIYFPLKTSNGIRKVE